MAMTDEVTAAHVSQLRRMVGELTDTTYNDTALIVYIANYPLIDERSERPYSFDTSTDPPTRDHNDDWLPTFDLHRAAADVWEEKAAGFALLFDFRADGSSVTHSQKYDHCVRQAAWHRARRSMQSAEMISRTRVIPSGWIGNLAEADD